MHAIGSRRNADLALSHQVQEGIDRTQDVVNPLAPCSTYLQMPLACGCVTLEDGQVCACCRLARSGLATGLHREGWVALGRNTAVQPRRGLCLRDVR